MTPKLIAASAYPSSASSPFGSTPTKASRLHPLLALVFAGLASTLATSTQAHYTIQTLAGTATEQRTEQTASGTNRLQSHSHTYKAAGSNASQTTTQDYPRDASGSLTRLGSQTLQYNAQGRIAAATTAGGSTPAYSYQYNSSAQRLLKTDHRTSTTATTATPATEATLYADDATGSTVLGQYSNQRSTNSAAPAGEADSTEVLWLPTASGPMPIATQINGRLYAIDSDHLNTPRRLTNAQGQVVWQWLITGYGEVAPTTGATGYAFEAPQLGGSSNTSGNVYSEEVNFKLRYPGQVWDEETGLSYNLNRYYDAQAGRYVQSDPIGLDGGWNRFGYVSGNPLNMTDPQGLFEIIRPGGPPSSFTEANVLLQRESFLRHMGNLMQQKINTLCASDRAQIQPIFDRWQVYVDPNANDINKRARGAYAYTYFSRQQTQFNRSMFDLQFGVDPSASFIFAHEFRHLMEANNRISPKIDLTGKGSGEKDADAWAKLFNADSCVCGSLK